MELRAALKTEHGKRLKALIAFSCVHTQVRVIRYLFPDVRVDFLTEMREGRVIQWLKKL